MEKKIQAKVLLRVRRKKDKWILEDGKIHKDGSTAYWTKTPWEIRSTSALPKSIFFVLRNYLENQINQIPKDDEKCFDTMAPKIRVALCGAAPRFGCEFRNNSYGGIRWRLDGKWLVTFAIVNFEKHHKKPGPRQLAHLAERIRNHRRAFAKMEYSSRAMLRIGIVVLKGGKWEIVPGKTLPVEKRSWAH